MTEEEIQAFPNTDPSEFLITLEKHTTVYSEDDSKIEVDFGDVARIHTDETIELELESAWKLKEKYDLTELEAKRLVLSTLSHEVEHYNSSDLESKQKIIEEWPQAPKLAGDIVNIVEDCYIDNKRLQKFEGLQKPERIKKADFANRMDFNGKINAENLVKTSALVFLCEERPRTDSEFINEFADNMEDLRRETKKADKQEERLNIAEKIISTILDNVHVPDNLDTPDLEDFEGMEGKAEDVQADEERQQTLRTEEEQEEIEEEREKEVEKKSISIESEPEEEEDSDSEEEEEDDSDSDSGNNGSSDSDSEEEDSEDGKSSSEPSPNSEDDGDKNGDSEGDSDSEEDSDSEGDSEGDYSDKGSSDSDSEDKADSEADSSDGSSGTPEAYSKGHDKKKELKGNSTGKGDDFTINTDRFVAKNIKGGMGASRNGKVAEGDLSEIEHESDLLSDDVKEVLEEMDDDKDMDKTLNKESGSDLDVKKSVRYLSGDKSQRDIYKVNREDRPDKRVIGVTIDASGSMSGKGMKQALQATTALSMASDKLGDDFTANTHWSELSDKGNTSYYQENGHDTDVTWITKIGEDFDVSDFSEISCRIREPIMLGIKETRAEMQKSRKKGDKVLFVIHDGNPTITEEGFPYHQCGVDEDAIMEVKEEVEKCRRLGIKVIGLAVGNDMEEWALNDMFGASGWFKFDMEELPEEILRIYREQAY